MPTSRVAFRSSPRTNGWECPWHPLQILAWTFILLFCLLHYGFTVFYFPSYWRIIGYVVPGLLFLVHVTSTVVTTSIDPAEPNVRAKLRGGGVNNGEFDPSLHDHVIEDLHCHLCDVDVHSSAKHCRLCDKCIYKFDHHCKWLNTCIGARNYKCFIVSITSGVIATLLNTILSLVLFILFFADRNLIRYSCQLPINVTGCNDQLRLFGAAVPDPVFPSLTGIITLLAFIATGLLGHLTLFHFYLMYKGVSTYDYIIGQRDTSNIRNDSKCCRRQSNRITPLLNDQPANDEQLQKDESTNSTHSTSSAGKVTFGRTPPSSDIGEGEDYTIPPNEEFVILNETDCDINRQVEAPPFSVAMSSGTTTPSQSVLATPTVTISSSASVLRNGTELRSLPNLEPISPSEETALNRNRILLPPINETATPQATPTSFLPANAPEGVFETRLAGVAVREYDFG